MDARLRLTFFCGTCLGLAVGFSLGHVSLWQRALHSTEVRTASSVVPSDFASTGLVPLDYSASAVINREKLTVTEPLTSPTEPTMPAPGGAIVLNDPDLGDEPVHADAIVELPAAPPVLGLSTFDPLSSLATPATLPVCEASPLVQTQSAESPANVMNQPGIAEGQNAIATPGNSQRPELDPEVVQMLKDELEGVTDQQREVWADTLQGMNPADAAGVILMWKKFGQDGASSTHFSAPPPLFRSSHPDLAPAPLVPSGALKSLPDSLSPPDDLGVRIQRHNQANRETCGFLELVPLFQEVPFDQENSQQHVRVVGYRLHTQGMHVKTGNPAHVAVQRGCFFAVQLPGGEERYTRVGRLVLDAERRLCIDLGDQDLPIAPEVRLPAGATRFLVSNGQLRVEVLGQADPTDVGPLQVVEFFDASRLRPLGNAIYESTVASGPPKLVPAELVMESLEFPMIESASRMAER